MPQWDFLVMYLCLVTLYLKWHHLKTRLGRGYVVPSFGDLFYDGCTIVHISHKSLYFLQSSQKISSFNHIFHSLAIILAEYSPLPYSEWKSWELSHSLFLISDTQASLCCHRRLFSKLSIPLTPKFKILKCLLNKNVSLDFKLMWHNATTSHSKTNIL